MPKISSPKTRLANPSRNAKKTNSTQPSTPKNIEVAHGLALQLHHGRIGFTEDIQFYKKRGTHDIEVESADDKEKFATQFSNFMRKHLELVISHVSIPQINFDIGTTMPQVVPSPSSVGSTPDQQKYPVNDINEPTP
jgi:hypothetical protein